MGLGLFTFVFLALARCAAYPYLFHFFHLTTNTLRMRVKHQTNPPPSVVEEVSTLKKKIVGCVVAVGVLSLWGRSVGI